MPIKNRFIQDSINASLTTALHEVSPADVDLPASSTKLEPFDFHSTVKPFSEFLDDIFQHDPQQLPEETSASLNLIESATHPLICQVCGVFSTDNPETLIAHAERSRIPLNIHLINQQVTTHSGSTWHCNICTYRSGLKANFQLHCKTEKHAQRLSLLAHMWEGSLASEADSTQAFCLRALSHVGYSSSSQSSTFVQLRCLPCGFFTCSVHKFRIHCQQPTHTRLIHILSSLVQKRSEMKASLSSFTFAYVEYLKSVMTSGDQKARQSGGFSKAIRNLLLLLTDFKVMYKCASCPRKERSYLSVADLLRHFHSTKHQVNYIDTIVLDNSVSSGNTYLQFELKEKYRCKFNYIFNI